MKIKTAVCLLPLLALAGCGENNSAPLCNGTDNLASSMTEWLNEAMAKEDSGAKKYPVKVVGLDGFLEYKTVPMFMGTMLYNDYKNSRVCSATLNVDFTPNGDERNIEQIGTRYQIYTVKLGDEENIMTVISGYDLDELGKDGVKKLIEVLKK